MAQRVGRASLAVFFAHVLFKLVGVIQAAVMARYIPHAVLEPIYVFAFEGCIFNLFLMVEEAIGPSFLPVLSRELSQRGEKAGWAFANTVVTLVLVTTGMLAVAVMAGRDWIVARFTAWDPVRHAERWALGHEALVWLAPVLVGFSVGTVTYLLLNAHKRFFAAACGEAAWKAAAVCGVLGGMGWLGWDYHGLLLGLLVGSLAKVATHLLGLGRRRRYFRLALDVPSPAVRELGLLILPLLAGILLAKVRDIFNNVYILSRLDTPGLMMANSFGRKLANTANFLLPYTLSIAVFPFFCDLAIQEARDRLAGLVTHTSRLILSVIGPAACVVAALASPLTALVYHGGHFSVEDVSRTAVSTACYIFLLPATVVETLLMRVFWANRLMISVTVIGAFFAALSMAISAWGIVVMGWQGSAALATVALGAVLARAFKAGALAIYLRRRYGMPLFPLRETLTFCARTASVATAAAAAAWVCVQGFETWAGWGLDKLRVIGMLVAGGLGATGGFLLAVRLTRLREPVQMLHWLLERIGRNAPITSSLHDDSMPSA